ncbi:MAG: multicopper oxidase domain-containing protein [Myxococcales bacterium]|jgi:FtsP/CotA-like multicopper oxidase with cupredoxin domain|nr:multicopper oxidase domain-containing protein [Myxococcales bacterium]
MSKQKKAKRGGGARALAMSFQRRDFLKLSGAAGVTAALPFSRWVAKARADGDMPGLSNPALQPRFTELVPNALDPGFIYDTKKGKIKVAVGQTTQMTGLVAPDGTTPVPTTVWGYGDKQFYTWPGRTFEVRSNEPLEVKWENRLIDGLGDPLPYIITGKDNTSIGFGDYTGRPVFDESLHWAYSLHGYEGFSIENDGVPIVAHVHGGHSDFAVDGNPEFFFSPGWEIRGPQWVDKKYLYDNRQPAGTVWYHDHALGITRLNVYAGMAGFYIIRDEDDTGLPGNPLSLPAFPYEAAFAIQDRMFKDNGEFFYPAFPGDPFYADFITDEGADLPPDIFPGGGPTALAEFFGDHMVVNGKIWPKMDVEPRNYRLRLLNGCDSRFLAVQFFEVPSDAEDFSQAIQQLPFTVIGSDQGLASSPTTVDTLLLETGSRYDLVFDFKSVAPGNRVIMKNIGGDEPFGGDIPGPQVFGETDRIMAFDVVLPIDSAVDDVSPSWNGYGPVIPTPTRLRKVALFEGMDEFGRLQPLLGTAEPATDYLGNPINWPNTPDYVGAGLVGQMEGSIAWHNPTTENPALNSTEEWEVWNATGDAHPVHLHLVHFEILGRQEIHWDSHTTEDDRLIPNDLYGAPSGDGTYLVSQPVVQHNGLLGDGFKIMNKTYGPVVPQPTEYVENAPKDMVTALPGQITRIKMTFDKPGRYVWHCHILSHEDHEMMRVLHVGPGA